MKKPPIRPLMPEEKARLAQIFQVYFIDSLMADNRLPVGSVVFQGGSSLALVNSSPRFSEDVDFLVERTKSDRLDMAMRVAADQIKRLFTAADPNYRVELKRERGGESNLMAYDFVLSNPSGFQGYIHLKAEFWQVDRSYLESYPAKMSFIKNNPEWSGAIKHPVQTAEIGTVLADKLVAVGLRPYTKYRDLFDIWWLHNQLGGQLDWDDIAHQYGANLRAYNPPEGWTPVAALRGFADDLGQAGRAAAFEKDMRRWFPKSLYRQMFPGITQEVFDAVISCCSRLADCLEDRNSKRHGCRP